MVAEQWELNKHIARYRGGSRRPPEECRRHHLPHKSGFLLPINRASRSYSLSPSKILDTWLCLPTYPTWRADILCSPFAFPADHVHTHNHPLVVVPCDWACRPIQSANRRLLAIITMCTREPFFWLFSISWCTCISSVKKSFISIHLRLWKLQFPLYIQIVKIDLMCLCSIS